MIHRILIIASLFAVTSVALASGKPKPTVVDQGSFGIFQNGQRVASETFVIRQYADSNVTSSELHDETSSGVKIEQSSELTLLPDGNLSRYVWKQTSPIHSSATVTPGDQVLTMQVVADGKNSDQSFFLSRATFVLDDNFFSTREVLLWRYLTSACQPHPNGGCDLVKTRFPVLIPRRHISEQVFIEFKGYEDTPLNGRPQRLRHFLMTTDGPDWHLWLDANHRLLRISIPDTNTEVLRQEK